MRTLAIVQARLGSSRLPGKVLKEIQGKPLLGYLLERLMHSKKINHIVVATTESAEDQLILDIAKQYGCSTFAGSENDVLDRAYKSALAYKGELLVRITADSPLIDPFQLDQMIEFYLNNYDKYDYVAFGKSYPEGQNAEVFLFKLLEMAWKEAKLPSQREHFTSFIWNQPERFKLLRIEASKDYSKLRWTVDESRDFQVVEAIIKNLYKKDSCFTMEDIISFLINHPEVLKLNSDIVRDEGYLLSLKKEI